MTVCISAIGLNKNKENIVIATDRMISNTLGQFEYDLRKFKCINKKTVATPSGNPFLFDSLIIDETQEDVRFIVDSILKRFKQKRLETIKRELLDLYNIDFEYVKTMIEKHTTYNDFSQEILKFIGGYKLGTTILLSGFSGNKSHIFEVNDINYLDFRELGFHAIGSGQQQAINTLLFQKQSPKKNVLETIYNVYKAKRNSEVVQGVGKDTDLIILSEEEMIVLSDNDKKVLFEIYEKELAFGKTNDLLKNILITNNI